MNDRSTDVLNALRLGWILSELLGRIRKGARPPAQQPDDPDYAPRLTVGEGTTRRSRTGLLFAAHRLLALSVALDVRCDDAPSLQALVDGSPPALERWLNGEQDRFLTPAQLRDVLEAWSLRVWAQLNARSEAAGLAFTLGTSLADTYWYLRKPAQRPQSCPRQEDWRELLLVYRLDVDRKRLETLRPHLPEYVVTILQLHLNQWSIGSELYRNADGRLTRLPRLLRVSHPIGILTWSVKSDTWWQRSRRFRLTHPLGYLRVFRRPNRSPELTAEEEIQLQDNLARQADIWSSLIFGMRTPTSYLESRDRLWIRLLTWGGVLLALLGLGLVFRWLYVLLSPMLAVGLSPLTPQIESVVTAFLRAPADGVADWVAVAVQLIPILSGLIALLIGTYRWTLRFYSGWNDRLTSWFVVRRRTLVPWDRQL